MSRSTSLGYKAYKTKGHTWFDLWDQTATCAQAMPDVQIDMDFNETLLTAEQGIPILQWMDQFPQVDIYESPIPQRDIQVTLRLQKQYALAFPCTTERSTKDVVKHNVCDGFVISGSATRVIRQSHVAETMDMRFWLQLVEPD